ncbi:MAG TPA: tRNA lysidine(34) synthetase TilS [Aestuariivirga sp.]|nr:tRNA lysidine(34) synthetase TilS [Aestuariivirga sp.]
MALAVSGGSDSMAMLRLAETWSGRRGAKPRLTVLTVDHGLRSNSAGEAGQVAEWSQALGLDHEVLVWTGAKPATGIQAKARNARYDLMGGWCRQNGVAWLLTAHTLEDQAETVLMRLARTTSIDSLAGIPRLGQWQGTRLFRPLLSTSRQALRDLLGQLGQSWIDDPSNEDERFERVRIRKAMPLLRELGITAEGLAEFARRAADAVRGLWGAAEDWVAMHVTVHEAGYCTIPLAPFTDQTEELKMRILALIVSRHGSGKMPEPHELELLAAWTDSGGSRRTLGGAIVVRRKASLLVGREPGRIDATPVTVPAGGEIVWDGRFAITAPAGAAVIPSRDLPDIPRCRDIPAFVQQGLPAVTQGGRVLAVPQLGLGAGVSARFLPPARR